MLIIILAALSSISQQAAIKLKDKRVTRFNTDVKTVMLTS